MDMAEVTRVLRKLALEAGAQIMEVYGQDDFNVELKADDSPVTIADQRADDLIYKGLSKAFPEEAIVTEEKADSHNVSSNRFFIVDPLDGTKEFVQRRGDFTVNIALVEDGVPIRGVVYAPAKKRLFYTDAEGRSVEESGSFDPDQPGTFGPINVAQPDNGSLIVVASKSHRDAATDEYINKYQVKDSAAAGSSLKFCLVATGEADLYPRLGRTMEWDTAAGHAVLAGAGGKVVRFDNHEPLTYGKAGYENPFFIAYAPGVQLKAG
jgi:3'(2'), 5'-bisphosphate nucleotidase